MNAADERYEELVSLVGRERAEALLRDPPAEILSYRMAVLIYGSENAERYWRLINGKNDAGYFWR